MMSQDLNHVILIGRLTRDADLKYTAGGVAVCKFALAVNKRRKDGDGWKDEASFFDVALLGKSAENLTQYLTKGKQVAIDGELEQRRWTQDGQNHSKVEILANSVQLLGGGVNSQESAQNTGKGHSRAPESSFTQRQAEPGTEQGAFPDDIPF